MKLSVALLMFFLFLIITTGAMAAGNNQPVNMVYTMGSGIYLQGEEEPLVNHPGYFSGMPALSSKDHMVYSTTFDVETPGMDENLHLYDLHSGKDWQITSGHSDFEATISPNGRKIVFGRIFEGPSKLMVMDVQNPQKPSEPRRLTNWVDGISETSPSWYGHTIAFSTNLICMFGGEWDEDNPYRMGIWARNVSTGAEYPLVDSPELSACDPSLGPNGWLFYTHYDIVWYYCYCPDDGWEWWYNSWENPVVWKLKIGKPGPGSPVVPGLRSWYPAADPAGGGVYVNAGESDYEGGELAIYRLGLDGTVEQVTGWDAFYPALTPLTHRLVSGEKNVYW